MLRSSTRDVVYAAMCAETSAPENDWSDLVPNSDAEKKTKKNETSHWQLILYCSNPYCALTCVFDASTVKITCVCTFCYDCFRNPTLHIVHNSILWMWGLPAANNFLYILYAIICNFTCILVHFGSWLSMMTKPKIGPTENIIGRLSRVANRPEFFGTVPNSAAVSRVLNG